MFKGVFAGKNARNRNLKILILSESHHYSKDDYNKTEEERREKVRNYRTENVVKNYLEQFSGGGKKDRAYYFFDKIVNSFSIDPAENRERFWNQVFFGNYVEGELCGIRDSRAKDLINAHSSEYNKSLFDFVNEEGIDLIFCFSRRVYNSLPQCKNNEKNIVGKIGRCNDFICKRKYLPNCEIDGVPTLSKKLTVYGFRHPSARGGFRAENYSEYLKDSLK